jgi:hypothetical protein
VHHHHTPQRLLEWPVVLLTDSAACLNHGLHAAHTSLDARITLALLWQSGKEGAGVHNMNNVHTVHTGLDARITLTLLLNNYSSSSSSAKVA